MEAVRRVRCPQAGRARRAPPPAGPACQTLNVFAPKDAAGLPVLVHLHDGHFESGWGSFQPSRRLLLRDVVIVTINYRIGAYGFLCLGTKMAPGNAGLKDQVAALYWIHRNIAKFGGNQNDVILYGTGAGAVSAEFLLISGVTRGLVHRVILESGSSISPMSLLYNPRAIALDIATSLGYEDTGQEEDLTYFYQNISMTDLVNISNVFMPCLESESLHPYSMINKDPMEALEDGLFEHIPLLIAYSMHENLFNQEKLDIFKSFPENFQEILPNNLEFDNEETRFKIAEQIKGLYFGECILGQDLMQCIQNYMNDVFTVYPVVKSAVMHAAASPSPVYLMEFRPQGRKKSIYEYIFSTEDFNSEEEILVEQITSLWSNFIKFGDPTPLETSTVPIVWEPVTAISISKMLNSETSSCLVLGKDLEMSHPSATHLLVIWDHIYDSFYKLHISL